MKKKLLSVALAAALALGALAGCAKEQPRPADDDLVYKTLGMPRDTVLLTVDGHGVSAEEYLFWLVNGIAEQKGAGNLADDAAWDADIEDKDARTYLKDDALDVCRLYRVVENKAGELGITVTGEQQADLEEQLARMGTQLAMYGSTMEDWLANNCISEEGFRHINAVAYLNEGLLEKLSGEGGELSPTDEEMDAFTEAQGIYNVKHILLNTFTEEDGKRVSMSDEEKAVVKADADAILADIRADADPAERFDELMRERSQDPGLQTNPDGYFTGKGQMVAPFEEASLALEVGGISEVVESDFGYHIILRLSARTDAVRQYCAGQKLSEAVEGWMDEAEVKTTKEYDAIDPKAFFEKLTAELEAMAAAKATPAPTGEPTAEPGAPTATPAA